MATCRRSVMTRLDTEIVFKKYQAASLEASTSATPPKALDTSRSLAILENRDFLSVRMNLTTANRESRSRLTPTRWSPALNWGNPNSLHAGSLEVLCNIAMKGHVVTKPTIEIGIEAADMF